VQGGLKAALFGRQCGILLRAISDFPAHEVTVLSLWSMAALFAFWVYFTLSGYCDMAQGIGAMFGIFLPKNYYYPYQSRDVGDFFERFNMTLTSFLRRNIPLPMLFSGMLFGLWFGFRVNYLLWGLFLTVFMLLERFVFQRLLRIIPTLIRRIITLGVVLFSFALMAAPTVAEGFSHMHGMLGLGGHEAYNDIILHQLTANWIILLLAVFFTTNIVNILVLWIHRSMPRMMDGILAAANIALLVILTAII
jgi:alginate O-acetyltransferase complex protein AlgI